MTRGKDVVVHHIQALCPVMVSSCHRHVPRAPLPTQGVTSRDVTSGATSEGITPPSSLLRAHAPNHHPLLLPSASAWSAGLCRLPQAPAGRWSFSALSLQSLHGCLDPYPAVFPRCIYPFLPGEHRPHVRSETFDTPIYIPTLQFQWVTFFEAAVIPLCSGPHVR
jgi:hypothetical protein